MKISPYTRNYCKKHSNMVMNHLLGRKKVIENLQSQYPETNGKYIVWEENNAGSKDPTDWTRRMANVLRTGVTQNIKGCLEPHNANGMSDLLTTNILQENPAARRPIWWVYYMFAQMTGEYVQVETRGTDEFTAAASVDEEGIKIIFAKNDCKGSVDLQLKNQPFIGVSLEIDLYKITDSENNGLEYQYSLEPILASKADLNLSINDVNGNESWLIVVKKPNPLPGFFHQLTPDDGEIASPSPTLEWSKARDAVSYTVKIARDRNLSNLVISKTGIEATSHAIEEELEIGHRYYWTVLAENERGTRPVSNRTVYSFLVGESLKVPGQFGPYLPSLDAPNQTLQPEFQWSPAYNADSYQVVVSKNADLSNPVINISGVNNSRNTGMYGPNSLMYYQPEIKLEYDTKYYWTVYSVNKFGKRPMNGPLRYFTTKAEGKAPKEFDLLTPINGEGPVSARTELSWEISKNAFFYKLEVSTNADFSDPILIHDRMIHTKYTFEPNLLLPDTSYYWRVTAYTKDLNHSMEANRIGSFKTESVPCSPLLYATQPGDQCATLWFRLSLKADSYKIVYGTEPGIYEHVINDVTESPFTVTGLKNGTPYYFAVIAVNGNGDSSVWNERRVIPLQQ